MQREKEGPGENEKTTGRRAVKAREYVENVEPLEGVSDNWSPSNGQEFLEKAIGASSDFLKEVAVTLKAGQVCRNDELDTATIFNPSGEVSGFLFGNAEIGVDGGQACFATTRLALVAGEPEFGYVSGDLMEFKEGFRRSREAWKSRDGRNG